MKGRSGKLRRRQVEHQTAAEKLEYIIDSRFPAIALEDVEELEEALTGGLSLTDALDALLDENEIPADKRAQMAADLQAARDLKSEAQSEERLEALYREIREQERIRIEVADESDRVAREQSSFYNQPAAEAKFDDWVDLPFWTADEATALSFGKEPRVVNFKLLQADHSTFATEYRKRHLIISRQTKVGTFGSADRVDPRRFVSWLGGTRIEPPRELILRLGTTETRIAPGLDAEETAPEQLLLDLAAAVRDRAWKLGYDPPRKKLCHLIQSVLFSEGYRLSGRKFNTVLWAKLQDFQKAGRPREAEADAFDKDCSELENLVREVTRRFDLDSHRKIPT